MKVATTLVAQSGSHTRFQTRFQPRSGAGSRIRLSLRATLAGWCAAALVTLVFEVWELSRNLPLTGWLPTLLEGCGLWAAFTVVATIGVWCVVVLPLALWIPARPILAHRGRLVVGAPVLALALIGWKLGVWHTLLFERGGDNPLEWLLFWNYAFFGMIFAWVTARMYVRGLERM